MFYFSNIKNTRVHNIQDDVIGNLKDIFIETGSNKKFPPIAGILVFDKKEKKEKYISHAHVATWSIDGIILKPDSQFFSEIPSSGILSLNNNVLDKQIVDLAGARVVRVNDLQFSYVQGILALIAIDVSTSGLLRRLGFHKPVFNLFKPVMLEWKNVHIFGDKLQVNRSRNELIKLHPADIANIVEKLNLHQGSQLLKSLDEVTAAKVMEELEPEIQKLLVQHLGVDRAASIMERMSMDELVDLLQLLPDRETKRIFEEIPLQKDMKKVRNILAYDEDTAGGLMTTEFITARIESTVRDIKDIIKKVSPLHRFIYFVYIVDIENKFLGVVSMRKLIISNDEMHVKDLLKDNENMPALKISNNLSQIAEMMTKYNLMSVAVLDENNKILGVVTIDDIMRCLVPKA